MTDHDVVLIAYDNSQAARQAIVQAGQLLCTGDVPRAQVLYVWEPLTLVCARYAAGAASLVGGDFSGETAAAEKVVAEGVRRAEAAGFSATGTQVCCRYSARDELQRYIADLQPRLIVLGSRGHSAIHDRLLGSISHHVARHSHVPLLIVPPPGTQPSLSAGQTDTAAFIPA